MSKTKLDNSVFNDDVSSVQIQDYTDRMSVESIPKHSIKPSPSHLISTFKRRDRHVSDKFTNYHLQSVQLH
jgi:hypothetical protein